MKYRYFVTIAEKEHEDWIYVTNEEFTHGQWHYKGSINPAENVWMDRELTKEDKDCIRDARQYVEISKREADEIVFLYKI